MFQILNGVQSLTIDHNTALTDGPTVVADSLPSPGLVFQNDIVSEGTYGVFGSDVGTGTAALAAYFPGYVFRNNAIIGGSPSLYPSSNYFPSLPSQEVLSIMQMGIMR